MPRCSARSDEGHQSPVHVRQLHVRAQRCAGEHDALNVDNWRRFIQEPAFGNPYVAEIYADPTVRDKVVLTIMDALACNSRRAVSKSEFHAAVFYILASRDPVASTRRPCG